MSVRSALGTARRTVLVAAVPGLAGLAAIAGPMAHADAATTCASDSCIQQFATHVGGLELGTTLETTVPTSDRLFVYDTEARPVSTTVDTRLRTTHVVTSPSTLTPNTKYLYRLEERDQSGNIAARTGTFTTLHRQVDVMFQTVTVSNDSDGWTAGDFRTWVRAGNTVQLPALGQQTITDGQTTPLAALVRTRDAGTTLTVRTELLDNDCSIPDFPFISCPFPSSPTWNNGSTPLWDWSTAVGTLNTANATTGVRTFHIAVDASVGFTVNGWYSVTFVA